MNDPLFPINEEANWNMVISLFIRTCVTFSGTINPLSLLETTFVLMPTCTFIIFLLQYFSFRRSCEIALPCFHFRTPSCSAESVIARTRTYKSKRWKELICYEGYDILLLSGSVSVHLCVCSCVCVYIYSISVIELAKVCILSRLKGITLCCLFSSLQIDIIISCGHVYTHTHTYEHHISLC